MYFLASSLCSLETGERRSTTTKQTTNFSQCFLCLPLRSRGAALIAGRNERPVLLQERPEPVISLHRVKQQDTRDGG
jgi:hypothetical protein